MEVMLGQFDKDSRLISCYGISQPEFCHTVNFCAAVWLARSKPHCVCASDHRKPPALACLQASGLFVDPIWLAYKDRNQPHKHSDLANRRKLFFKIIK